MNFNKNNIDLLREQIDLNSDLISKLERMEVRCETNHSELNSLNNSNAELNMAATALNYELEGTIRKLADVSNERDRLSRQFSDHRKECAVTNSDIGQSLAENKRLRDQLFAITEEMNDMRCRLHDCDVSSKKQKIELEETIDVIKPELEAYKHLNESLHIEIAALEKNSTSQRKDTNTLKDHINDLTKALDGFAVKFDIESSQKKLALQQLHEKAMEFTALEEKYENAMFQIEEFHADHQNDLSLIVSRQSDKELLASELSQVTADKNLLSAENSYLKKEFESVQCILADQLQLRLQDRANYEALLVASDESIQHAIEDSKDRLDDMTNELLIEAHNANEARNAMSDHLHQAEQKCEKLTTELSALHAEYDRVCKLNEVKDKYAVEVSNTTKILQQRSEKEYSYKLGALSLRITEISNSLQDKTTENRDNIDHFVLTLGEYQENMKSVREDAWNLRSKVKQLETQLAYIRSKSVKYGKQLTDSVYEFESDQKAAFQSMSMKYNALNAELSAVNGRVKEEATRSMYLTREVTNLKLELYEARRGRL